MPTDEAIADARREILAALPSLAGLTPGRSGNLSRRVGEAVAITPSGVAYDDVDAEDVPVLTLTGEAVAGTASPSSELPMHAAIYRAVDAGAVAHAHAPWSTTLAVIGEALPAVHYALARAGGEVPVVGYETYGSRALAEAVASTLADGEGRACLLANHGVVAVGADPGDAVETLHSVEFVAQLYCRARQLGRDPEPLPRDELDRVAAKFETYGQ